MTAHGEAEQFRFIAQTLRAIRLRERDGGQRGVFVALEKEALRVRPLREVLQLPKLRSARLAEAVERADADEIQHFGGAGIHAVVEIAQGGEWPAFPLAPIACERRGSEVFDHAQRHPDGIALGHEVPARGVHVGR